MSNSKSNESSRLVKEYYLNSSLSDLTLIVDGERLPSHKFVLSAKSPVFKVMFFGNFKERNDSQIEIKDTSIQAFKIMLKYCYYELIFDCEEFFNAKTDYLFVMEVFKISHRFQINGLCDIIAKQLVNMIELNNICNICEFCQLYDVKDLLNGLIRFVNRFESQIVSKGAFITESFVIMAKLLGFIKSQTLRINAFKLIFKSIPEKYIKNFKELIDFELCSVEDMIELRKTDLFSDSFLLEIMFKKYKQLILNYKQVSHQNKRLQEEYKALSEDHKNERVMTGDRFIRNRSPQVVRGAGGRFRTNYFWDLNEFVDVDD